jgi:hypothetical protein
MKTTINIDNEKIKGILCCAFEGGSNYWAQIDDYEIVKGSTYEDFRKDGKFQNKDNYWHPSQIVPLTEGCSVIVKDQEEGKVYKLNLGAIHKGIEVMAAKYPRHFGDFLSENSDSTTGDVFLQCCLLGEVVYG